MVSSCFRVTPGGSARVVFEALSAGCYVITTPNSGSIVQGGVHGALVPLGDAIALRRAIDHQSLGDPTGIGTIGRANAELIRDSYLQRQYGEKGIQVYRTVCPERAQLQ